VTAENRRLQQPWRSALSSEEELPRPVKANPALLAEPTSGSLGNVKESVATFADQFGPVPGKEGSGWLPNVDRMRHSS
jgi:hypothetical protein